MISAKTAKDIFPTPFATQSQSRSPNLHCCSIPNNPWPIRNIAHYLDLPSTRAALGIPLNDTSLPISHKNFSSCSNSVGYAFSLALDEFHPTHHHVAALLDRGVRALIYVGTYDWICNHVGNERWLVGDDFAGSWWGGERWRREDRTEWVVDGKKAGEKRSFGPLTFATVEGAGHMVCLLLYKEDIFC